MPYNFNGQNVDINNITLQHLLDGIIGEGSPRSYSIDVQHSGASYYTLNGNDRNGYVSGNNATVNINVGDNISFNVNASGHPFWIKTSAITGIGNAVSDVTNNGSENGSVSWTPSSAGTYYYICQYHGNMNGVISVGSSSGVVGIGTTSSLTLFTPGSSARSDLLRFGMNNLDTFFGTKYTDEYNSIIANISADTKTRFENLGGNLSGLSTEAIGITTNLTGCIGTAINTWTPTVKNVGTYIGLASHFNQNSGIITSGNYTPYYLTRWGADATDSMLYAQLNFMNHVKFNSNGGATVANNVGISSANAINLPISERLQVEWASTLNPYPVWKDLQSKGSQTNAEVEHIFRTMVSFTNENSRHNLFNGEPWSLSWFLIHGINDSNNVGIGTSSIDDTAASAYIDNATKDLVIQNKYNFNYTRDADIQHKLCTEAQYILGIGNSTGIVNWWNTTPLSFASPHNLLEAAARTMKVAKSQSIGATNLDALDYNYFETRISRKNLGIGNTFLFTQLVDKGWL
tara:strand:+ start:663 stop:2213 length:1551 start_codon:yes stop_codon:yes gene_type:complete